MNNKIELKTKIRKPRKEIEINNYENNDYENIPLKTDLSKEFLLNEKRRDMEDNNSEISKLQQYKMFLNNNNNQQLQKQNQNLNQELDEIRNQIKNQQFTLQNQLIEIKV